jgi:hypothetical protein
MGEIDVIELKSPFVVAAFDEETGDWASLQSAGEDSHSLLGRVGPAFDLVVEGEPFFGSARRRVRHAELGRDGLVGRLVFEREGLRITHEVELAQDAPCLRQRVRIDVLGGMRRLAAVHYFVPGLALGDPAHCLVQAPGQVIPPDSPYTAIARTPLDCSTSQPRQSYPDGWLEPAPDQTPGMVVIENPHQGRAASIWHYSEVATAFPTIDGDGEYVSVSHHHQLAAWLRPGDAHTSGDHSIMLSTGTLEEHLAAFRAQAYGARLVSRARTSGKLSTARLLQIDPRPISEWTRRLPDIAELGFTLLYLMPVWSNQGNYYALLDHYAIDPRVGGEAELRAFVEEAHAHGLRVLFDFIPQGIGVRSPFVEEHPDWLVRDEVGRPFASHGWGPPAGAPATEGTYSLDWGDPEYRRYAVDWALWNVERFGIDGFRTDALHWKEPNFHPENPRPAYETMFGGVRLGEELRAALDRVRPDAILLGEVWGPIFQRSHDATYENGWLLAHVNAAWLRGEPRMSGAQWARHLADSRDAQPSGSLRAIFTANHDSDDVAQLARKSPLGDAVSFMHAFSDGFPFVWHRELAGREEFFRGLLRHRARLAGYVCSHRAARPDAAELFTAYWTRETAPAVLAVANPSLSPVASAIQLPDTPASPTPLLGSGWAHITSVPRGLSLELSPGGYALVRL